MVLELKIQLKDIDGDRKVQTSCARVHRDCNRGTRLACIPCNWSRGSIEQPPALASAASQTNCAPRLPNNRCSTRFSRILGEPEQKFLSGQLSTSFHFSEFSVERAEILLLGSSMPEFAILNFISSPNCRLWNVNFRFCNPNLEFRTVILKYNI